MKHIKRLTVLFLAIAFFTGCAMNNADRDDQNDVKIQNFDKDTDMNGRGTRIQNTDNDNMMRQADDVAAKVDDIKEVRNATVIVTDSTAYVAVVLRNGSGKVDKGLEQKIADEVKAADKSIDRVYVSSNPDFVNNMRDYGDQIRNGHPIRGLYDEFSQMVQRVFPTAR